MDFSDPGQRGVFFDVHSHLPREGPGDKPSTLKALALVKPLPDRPKILDIACGPGMQTLHLAELLPDANILGIDLHQPMTIEANRRIKAAGYESRVKVEVGDMTRIKYPDCSFDLIWCEGAAYNMGIEQALVEWKRLLKPGGKIALTEAVWLKTDPPGALVDFWRAYPDMSDIENRREIFRSCGYSLLGDFVLPENAWWDDYYGPMQSRLELLADKYMGNANATPVLDYCQLEIDLFARYADYYGYAFLIGQA